MTKSKMKNAQAKLGASVNLAGGQTTNEKVPSDHTSVSEVLTSKSTAREVQLAKVLALLRHGPKTTIELRRHSILMPATRVFELKRDHDCIITTELVALCDDEGVRHSKCARYHLVQQAAPRAAGE